MERLGRYRAGTVLPVLRGAGPPGDQHEEEEEVAGRTRRDPIGCQVTSTNGCDVTADIGENN